MVMFKPKITHRGPKILMHRKASSDPAWPMHMLKCKNMKKIKSQASFQKLDSPLRQVVNLELSRRMVQLVLIVFVFSPVILLFVCLLSQSVPMLEYNESPAFCSTLHYLLPRWYQPATCYIAGSLILTASCHCQLSQAVKRCPQLSSTAFTHTFTHC